MNGFALSGLIGVKGCIAIIDEGTGIAEYTAKKLKKRGIDAEATASLREGAGGVIYLGGLKKIGSIEEALDINREAFRMARTFVNTKSPGSSFFVTVQDTSGDFGLSGQSEQQAWLSGLTGLAKTANLEWEDTQSKALDIERGKRSAEEIAELIVTELFHGGSELEVGIPERGERVTLSVRESALGQVERYIEDDSVLVVSGGAKGVTAEALVALAQKAKLRFVLLGRSVIRQEPPFCEGLNTDAELKAVLLAESKKTGKAWTPAELTKQVRSIMSTREIKETIRRLEKAGSFARYISLDVQELKGLEKVFNQVRQEWGPISGIVHGAGLLADRLIAEKTDEQFERVFQTKVSGLWNLLYVTRNDPIHLICLFSSIAARTGNYGQCDYAMANEILNKVAATEASRRGSDCIVKSFNWGPWDGGMVTSELKGHFEQRGIPLLPPHEGAAFFAEELLKGSQDDIEIVATGGRSGIVSGREWKMDVLVDQGTYPFLRDHSFGDTPLIPIVLVLDWFVKAARSCCPDLYLSGCHDLKVLKGIRLEEWGTKTYLFTAKVKETYQSGTTVLNLSLQDEHGVTYYTARADMVSSTAGTTVTVPEIQLQPSEDDAVADMYREHLFHGPEFQAIDKLHGFSQEGVSAELLRIAHMHWGSAYLPSTLLDPLTFDGGLQLVYLWGLRYLGKITLPTRIESFIPVTDWKGSVPVSCYVRSKAVGSFQSRSDIYFLTQERNICSILYGVEMYSFEI
ncbi:SDR family NAD(P)-dependent oxidoreductase [Alkalihalobacillus sp. TS-13]|uniref:SDR family NAD(P)-dependent oxidoreductase n=1 Tax=Alkalihalobacillus sp. TS-13 TaxID=2842455 RepID=UPI001C881062|nr:SDR family NAD(P)-dependent oxidoreductase [Alkalihalobacillus sp. TS-13]